MAASPHLFSVPSWRFKFPRAPQMPGPREHYARGSYSCSRRLEIRRVSDCSTAIMRFEKYLLLDQGMDTPKAVEH